VWPWEELWRVPFIWRGIDSAQIAHSSDAIVSLLDFAPTILEYAGVHESVLAPPRAGEAERPGLPGRSLVPFIERGEPLEQRPAVVEFDEDWTGGPMCKMRGIVDKEFKLVIYPPAHDGLLFNLRDDPGETRNLWHDPALKDVKNQLITELLNLLVTSDRLDTARISGA
jgi:uncharacterized sulfatase